jgi:hypothetical protein
VTHVYQVMGPSVPRMLGRRRLIEQIERHILKPSPDHIQVVGPTLYGKSVLLSALVDRNRTPNAYYSTAAYADLRHSRPVDDAEFRRRFAEVVKSSLTTVEPDIAALIDVNDAVLHELLDLAFGELERQSKRLLVVLDGFDHVLAATGITRVMWDQLRALGQKSSFRLVTGSRQPLRELCRTDASRTSDFWEIFYDTPLKVGPFLNDDLDDLLAPLADAGVVLDGSARKELENWTGLVPVLTIAVLERLASDAKTAPVLTKANVDQVSATLLDQPPAHLQELWDDCGVDLRGDIGALSAGAGVLRSDLGPTRLSAVLARGYGVVSGNRVHPNCRLMSQYAVQQGPAVADLKRLFGPTQGFESNIRGLLELRLTQIVQPGLDNDLAGFVLKAVRDLHPAPQDALKWVRSVAAKAMTLIWTAELGADQRIPVEWTNEWKEGGERLLWLEANQLLPRTVGAQCNVLRLMTGAAKIRPRAKYITKPTALLVDGLHSVGDFGQHRDDFPESEVTVGFAAATVLSCIELLDSLSRDLAKKVATR